MKIATLALLVSAPVFAQDETARKQAGEVSARVAFEKTMKGAPYSAETVVESSQALADGNRITRKTTGLVYRDGEGRTRREEDVLISSMTANAPVSSIRKVISIIDPVAGFSYSLDPEHKIAWKTSVGGGNAIMGKLEETQVAAIKEKLAAEQNMRTATPIARGGGGGGAGGAVMARAGGARGMAVMSDAPLEHKTIDGLAVEGRKTTTVIPPGQVGNEQPITVISEEWRSPELNLLVLTRHADPRTGESTYRLQNVVRAEPDPSLFIVPSDYTVKETGIRRMEPR